MGNPTVVIRSYDSDSSYESVPCPTCGGTMSFVSDKIDGIGYGRLKPVCPWCASGSQRTFFTGTKYLPPDPRELALLDAETFTCPDCGKECVLKSGNQKRCFDCSRDKKIRADRKYRVAKVAPWQIFHCDTCGQESIRKSSKKTTCRACIQAVRAGKLGKPDLDLTDPWRVEALAQLRAFLAKEGRSPTYREMGSGPSELKRPDLPWVCEIIKSFGSVPVAFELAGLPRRARGIPLTHVLWGKSTPRN